MALNYENDIKIDETALDVEWLNHGTVTLRYIRHAAHARRVAKLAEERVKVVKAELIRKVNEDPEGTTNKAKPNIPEIEAYYRSNTDYQQAKREMIDAQYEADYAEMAQKEFSYGRKAALENLVVLHGQQYFAGPSVPRDLSRERQKREQQNRADDAVAGAMRRRR